MKVQKTCRSDTATKTTEKMNGDFIHMNDNVRVVLTQSGADFLNHRNEVFNVRFRSDWKTDYKEGDEYRTQLWCLFELFGEHCSIGKFAPFGQLQKI